MYLCLLTFGFVALSCFVQLNFPWFASSCPWKPANNTPLLLNYQTEHGSKLQNQQERKQKRKVDFPRLHPSRFWGNPNRATREHNDVLTSEDAPRGGWLPPSLGAGLCGTGCARGRGAKPFWPQLVQKLKLKGSGSVRFFFCFPPHIRTETEPFNWANQQNGYRPSAETWFSLIELIAPGAKYRSK